VVVPGGSLVLVGRDVIDGEHLECEVSQGEGGEMALDPIAAI
jgi:hypothetical protein